MKKLIPIFLLLLMMNIVFAQSDIEREIEMLNQELQGKEIPEPLGRLFGDQRVNLQIDFDDGVVLLLGIVTEDRVFEGITTGEIENPTLNVHTTKATIDSVRESDNPLSALKVALREKDISYEAVGFVNKIKFAFVSFFAKVAGLFVGEVEETENQAEILTAEEIVPKVVEEAEPEEVEEETSIEKESGSVIDENEGAGDDNLPSDEKIAEEINEDDIKDDITGNAIVDPRAGRTSQTHMVSLIDGGFGVSEIEISVGDTVIWMNEREGKYNNIDKALVVGERNCRGIKSKMFGPAEFYKYTFEEAGTCYIVDGIFTTQLMKVVVG